MKKFLSTLLIAGSLFLMPTTHAEVKTYTDVGEYYMSDFETFEVAQQRAKQRAEQAVCEQAGVYVKSYSRMKNFNLEEDVIETLTSGILKILDTQFHREHFDNNTTLIRVTVKVQIDDSDIMRWLNKSESEREELIKQNAELRRVNAEQEKQIEELKRQLKAATSQSDKEKISAQFVTEDNAFLSNQKVVEGWNRYYAKDYNGAIELHTEAITLNPNNALAYYGRAYAYSELKDYRRVIEDCSKAVQFNSSRLVDAYNNRGEAYRKLGDYALAIADYNKALELNPNYYRAYNNRAIAYLRLKNYEQAFADYEKALQIKPDYALPYYNRGFAHLQLMNWAAAVEDFSKYIQLAPNDADGYTKRGIAYTALGDEAKAQADFAKAKELK